ncbi:hypothetical protein PFNF135_04185 [Plasmodium falciparum NF135/5.C10]|uniref:Uncharacterized protein n=2 Tax=Plasmodium falciparum TaxID=5833 RepID=A0A024V4J4_PLAFA|nr:hypothetical protein PFFVO_03638 [Plasmodium falciparum Vietnam Oak-Knoll (FVO)]ETW41538.1 hypothetical protein PFNF135_04185 [Plasmodium falciparum NF135/5.C10]
MNLLRVVCFCFLCIIIKIKYASSGEGIFKNRVLNPFHYQSEKRKIMKHVNSLSHIFNDFKNNLSDLENTYDTFLKSIGVSEETHKHLINMNDENTINFIEDMNELKNKYNKFKDKIDEHLNNKKQEFDDTLKSTVKGFFYKSINELKGISKFVKYININARNLNKIITNLFSKATHLSDIYEENVNNINEIGKDYYKMKLKTLGNLLLSKYNSYNKKIKLISNEKYIDNCSNIFYIEMLKDYLQNNIKQKITMIDFSTFLEHLSFMELSYFFNTFLKNYEKGYIVYVINRVKMNYHNNKMIFIEIDKLIEIVNFIKKTYNQFKIDYIVIHIFNMYISVFINVNNILYHVNYDVFFKDQSIQLYNTYNYGYFFINQKLNQNKYHKIKEHIYILYLGYRTVNDNYLIYNRKQMIQFKKDNAQNIIQHNKTNTTNLFLNMYLLKLASEYNFYTDFLKLQHEYVFKFSVYNCNMILTYDSLNKFNIPNEKFTPHFKDVYILIIIYPGESLGMLCNFFNNYLFRESIFNLKNEESNVLEIYSDVNRLTLIANNKTKHYYVNTKYEIPSESLEKSLQKIQNCLKYYANSNYNDYFDYLNIFYFISSDEIYI